MSVIAQECICRMVEINLFKTENPDSSTSLSNIYASRKDMIDNWKLVGC